MQTVTLSEARTRLDDLVALAAGGERIDITDQGTPVASLGPVAREVEPIDFAALKAMTDKMTFQKQSAGDFIRAMRDSARH